MQVTEGLSPKAVLAGVIPALGTVAAVLVQWAVTGEYDRAELVTSLVGLSSAGLAALSAYLAAPGAVKERVVGPASDDLLPAGVPKS